MKYARFELGGRVAYGILEEGNRFIREIYGTPFGDAGRPGAAHPLDSVRILAPCRPSKIFALAHNYRDHLQGREPPREPQIFLKVPSAIIDPGDIIVLPSGQGRVDEEAELVVVIGKRCRSVSAQEALRYVLGYTCGNDVSARIWQKNDLNWWRAKSSDTFAPFGPWIATGLDPKTATITGRINGKEVQRCSPRDLIFDVPSLIAWISAAVTLEPGDLIYTGTAGAPAELHGGDVVEVEIDGIGTLSNRVTQG
ncbi:MAG: fumarylacetoacetate hydrolase family protein [Spirochaetia bacterium]|jgi:2-keto-4-pentenoate hydratase/2-oxohepta-3-ene-1,7-dioic acid hydratase in catechol pathway